VPEIPEGSAGRKPVIPAKSGNPVLQEPAGNKESWAECPAPKNTGGGA
jgi:hypothetical protein